MQESHEEYESLNSRITKIDERLQKIEKILGIQTSKDIVKNLQKPEKVQLYYIVSKKTDGEGIMYLTRSYVGQWTAAIANAGQFEESEINSKVSEARELLPPNLDMNNIHSEKVNLPEN